VSHAFENAGHLNASLLPQVTLFQNAGYLNAPLVPQVTLFKMPAI
jgi:hypothetical protein